MMAMAGWKINNFSIQISSIIKKLIQPAHISFSFCVRRVRNSHMYTYFYSGSVHLSTASELCRWLCDVRCAMLPYGHNDFGLTL